MQNLLRRGQGGRRIRRANHADGDGVAVIPALAYFGGLFLAVIFQPRKQNIQAVGKATADMRLSRQDWINLQMIFAPILRTLFLLVTPKEAIGCGPITALFAIKQILTGNACRTENLPFFFQLVQNSAGDAGPAGWWAMISGP